MVLAAELARDPITTMSSDAPLGEAIKQMAQRYVAHVMALDPLTGVPSGVLSSFDVATALGGARRRRPRSDRSDPLRPRPGSGILTEASVRSVMRPGILACAPSASIREAARCMTDHHVHCLAVIGVGVDASHGDRLEWGLLEDMDMVRAADRQALEDCAGAIASSAPFAIEETELMSAAARLIADTGARHLIVVDPTGLPTAVVSTLDVLWLLATSPGS